MLKCLLHHRYVDDPPIDLSLQHHASVVHDASRGTGLYRDAVAFSGTSWIEVPRAASMNEIGSLRLRLLVAPASPPSPARMNLVEGHLSFALFVTPELGVSFTILDRDGAWTGCASAPGSLQVGHWQTIEVLHDGVSDARLFIDGREMARNAAVRGPVRPIGALGIAIGRWPDAARYGYVGHLAELQIDKHDPAAAAKLLLLAPCIDKSALVKLMTLVGGRFASQKEMVAWAQSVQALGLQALQAAQGGSPAGSDATLAALGKFVDGLVARDPKAAQKGVQDLADPLRQSVDGTGRTQLGQQLQALRAALPLSDAELSALGEALCVGKLFPSSPPLTHVNPVG